MAIATYEKRQPLREDDLPLRDALEERGVAVVPFVWDGAQPDWQTIDACIIRSISDYNVKYRELVSWVRQVGSATTLWNPLGMTLWNAEKTYLQDLANAGVPTIPTQWLDKHSKITVDAILSARGWDDAVIKPIVGLGSQGLHRVGRGNPGGQRVLDELLRTNAVLIQPFLPSVQDQGESSLIFIAGDLTHAIKKHPAPGEFRVQKDWGGRSAVHEPTEAELAVAHATMRSIDGTPLFARVDLLADRKNEPRLIELELIEPDLFFRHEPAAASRMAEAIVDRLGASAQQGRASKAKPLRKR